MRLGLEPVSIAMLTSANPPVPQRSLNQNFEQTCPENSDEAVSAEEDETLRMDSDLPRDILVTVMRQWGGGHYVVPVEPCATGKCETTHRICTSG